VKARPLISVVIVGTLLLAIGVSYAQEGQPTGKPASPTADKPAKEKQTGPRLHLSQSEWDFGEVWYGDPCETEVQLKNVGDELLKILDVKSSCGCTVAKPKKRELAPGESDSMTVSYRTKKNAKHVSQTITIKTNDAVEPELKFRVKGTIKHVFDARPSMSISFGQLLSDTETSASIELTNNMEEKAAPEIVPLKADSPFDVKLEEIEPGMKYKLTATTRPPLKMGWNSARVTLNTGLKRLTTMSIPISVRASERVAVSPTRLVISEQQDNPSIRIIRLNFLKEHPVEITEVKCDLPEIQVTILPNQSRSTKRMFELRNIRVNVPAWNELPEEGATIEITTNDSDPKFQKFSVPIEKRKARVPVAQRKSATGQTLQPIVKPLPEKKTEGGEPVKKP
jgi:hypothetical protein